MAFCQISYLMFFSFFYDLKMFLDFFQTRFDWVVFGIESVNTKHELALCNSKKSKKTKRS